MNLLLKFKETAFSVLPIMAIVVFLNFTFAPLGNSLLFRFLLGGILLIIGLTIFLLGVDIGILPIGERCGAALTSKKNLPLLLIVSFFIGLMVTIAEPDVQVLANQIKDVSSSVNKWVLVIMIAIGVGIFVVFGLLRTIFSLKLKYIFIVTYVLIFALAFLCPSEFQGVAFDAGGATTGPMTVPFIMALGVGVATVRSSGKKSGDDGSFGLTGIASAGPIAAVCIYGIIIRLLTKTSEAPVTTAQVAVEQEVQGMAVFIQILPEVIKEVSMALFPLIVMFVLFQIFLLKMPPFQVRKMIQGVIYSYVGLILFLVGANGGFMPAGKELGLTLGNAAAVHGGWSTVLLVVVAFVFGAIVVCAEPAVWVLTEQVESVSGGNIKRKIMLIALSSGVALSIALSVLRLIFNFSLWYILIPGYVLALVLSLFCPPLFTGIAFDSGGVASGPMTSTFILSFTLGVAISTGTTSATSAFGVIALVAMTPLIAIQILGIIFNKKMEVK